MASYNDTSPYQTIHETKRLLNPFLSLEQNEQQQQRGEKIRCSTLQQFVIKTNDEMTNTMGFENTLRTINRQWF